MVVVEVPDAEEEAACCGDDAMADATAAGVVATHTLAASVRSSDAAIGSLVIFVRCSSLRGSVRLEPRFVRCVCLLLL